MFLFFFFFFHIIMSLCINNSLHGSYAKKEKEVEITSDAESKTAFL